MQNLYESSVGTFIGVKLTTKSTARLCGWMDQNLIQNPEPADKIHITLVISKNQKIGYHPKTYYPPILVDPATYEIDMFGQEEDVLVLKFQSEYLEQRHLQLRKKYNLPWDFPDYSPHITLTKDVQEISTDLIVPDFDLEIDREYVEEFISDATE